MILMASSDCIEEGPRRYVGQAERGGPVRIVVYFLTFPGVKYIVLQLP